MGFTVGTPETEGMAAASQHAEAHAGLATYAIGYTEQYRKHREDAALEAPLFRLFLLAQAC